MKMCRFRGKMNTHVVYNLFPQEKISSSIKGSHHRTNFLRPNLNLFFRLNFFESILTDSIGLSRKFFFLYTRSAQTQNLIILNLFENGLFSQNQILIFLDFCQMLSTPYRGQTHTGRGARRIFCNSTQLRPRAN